MNDDKDQTPFDFIDGIVTEFLRRAPWAIGGALLMAIVILAGTAL